MNDARSTRVQTNLTATPEEKPRLWQQMTKIWPPYDEYQVKTSRNTAVVILEPVQ